MTTILTALLASLFGGVVGSLSTTWLRVELERRERWRDRLVDAAIDFGNATEEALLTLNEVLRALPAGGDDVTIFSGDARRAVGVAVARVSPFACSSERVQSRHLLLARYYPSFDLYSTSSSATATRRCEALIMRGAYWRSLTDCIRGSTTRRGA